LRVLDRSHGTVHEPRATPIGSAIFLGEVITPLQALGGAVMIAALVAFQLRR
jgi:probable blue pigment (indigoidine) exporter